MGVSFVLSLLLFPREVDRLKKIISAAINKNPTITVHWKSKQK